MSRAARLKAKVADAVAAARGLVTVAYEDLEFSFGGTVPGAEPIGLVPIGLVLCGLPTLQANLLKARTYSERMFRGEEIGSLAGPPANDAVGERGAADIRSKSQKTDNNINVLMGRLTDQGVVFRIQKGAYEYTAPKFHDYLNRRAKRLELAQ